MKALLCGATFAFLASTPGLGADAVSLVGTWTGQRDRIAKIEGRRGGLATLVITEQQGNTFAGRLKRSNPTGDEEEPLWGAFTPDFKLMMGSDDEGFLPIRFLPTPPRCRVLPGTGVKLRIGRCGNAARDAEQ